MHAAPLSWTQQDILNASRGTAIGGDWRVSGVSIDSRTAQSGDLFIAIKGPRFDGHHFLEAAQKAGCRAALISDADRLPEGFPAVKVDDTLTGLEQLGTAGRGRSTAKIAAVTGSVGKTGVKEALAHALGPQGGCHSSPGSFNNHWGVPLSLSRLPRRIPYGVFEIGMNHPGEITPLAGMVKPQVAIITNVASVHRAFFDSEEQIAAAKAEIFTGIADGGAVLLNRDNRHFAFLATEAEHCGIPNIHSFGADPVNDCQLINAELAETHSDIEAGIFGIPLRYRLGIPGAHWVTNSLAVLGAVFLLGADVKAAAQSLAGLTPAKRRGERHQLTLPGGTATLIDDSYNANPGSMRAALAQLGRINSANRKIAVLGDMRELGAAERAEHAALKEAVEAAGVDPVFCHGPLMRALAEVMDVTHHATAAEQIHTVKTALRPGDVIMTKGSAATKTSIIADGLVAAFGPAPDREG